MPKQPPDPGGSGRATPADAANRPRVLLTRRLPETVMAELSRHTDLTVNPHDRPMTRAELAAALGDREGILSLVTDRIDAELLAASPRLRVVSNYAVGYDNIDIAAASERGVIVTNTPDVLTATTADMAFALILAVARRVVEGHRLVSSGEWPGWAPLQLLGTEVSGATLGLVGLGRIGRAMVPRAHGFGMRVLYWNRTRLSAAEETRLGVEYSELDELLAHSRFVSLHLAASAETRHLIDSRALDLLGPESYLINTARGTIVDEAALVAALRAGKIAGAGLDVFEREPLLTAGLSELGNVVLAPHLGSATRETRTAMGLLAVRNLLAALAGEEPPHRVN